MSELVLYRRIASRAFSALWMLEELGVAYRDEAFAPSDPRPAALYEVSPSGLMPAIADGEARVTEAPAICLYLADKYGYGTLAPRIEDPARGRYLQWTVYATAVLEPARELQLTTITRTRNDYGVGWPKFEAVAEHVATVLEAGPWLLGERFTAADVMLGSVVSISLFCGTIPALPALVAYNERLSARPANQRAQKLNWPPELFGGVTAAQ
jgi:glutathione S-transferase